MKLKRFSKLTDIQKMSIAFFVGLFVMLGCITLYKTFAIYKEEKTFEVIEGTIPNFTKKDKDLEIAIMVDGKSSSETPREEYYYVTVECEKDEADTLSGEWDYTNKRVNMSGYITKPAVCTINFNSVLKSIIVDGEEKDNIPDKGDYQYNLTCENVTNSSFNEETYKPVITGVKENSSCNIVFKSTNNIITKIKLNGEERESYPSKEINAKVTNYTCTTEETTLEWDYDNWKPIINKITNETTCEIEFDTAVSLYDFASVGDYIAYIPEEKKFIITEDMTGYSKEQEINPSELKLWRIINKNKNGTVDIVSEYIGISTSEKYITFSGKEGYRKFVGSLNAIAKQYETEGITSGSHHFGYSGEQDTCSKYNACSDQKAGSIGGVGAYKTLSNDIRYVNKAYGGNDACLDNCGGLKAYKASATTNLGDYWVASRYVENYYNDGRYSGTIVDIGGSVYYSTMTYTNGESNSSSHGIRPIVTLKSGLSATESEKDGKKLWTVN